MMQLFTLSSMIKHIRWYRSHFILLLPAVHTHAGRIDGVFGKPSSESELGMFRRHRSAFRLGCVRWQFSRLRIQVNTADDKNKLLLFLIHVWQMQINLSFIMFQLHTSVLLHIQTYILGKYLCSAIFSQNCRVTFVADACPNSHSEFPTSHAERP